GRGSSVRAPGAARAARAASAVGATARCRGGRIGTGREGAERQQQPGGRESAAGQGAGDMGAGGVCAEGMGVWRVGVWGHDCSSAGRGTDVGMDAAWDGEVVSSRWAGAGASWRGDGSSSPVRTRCRKERVRSWAGWSMTAEGGPRTTTAPRSTNTNGAATERAKDDTWA